MKNKKVVYWGLSLIVIALALIVSLAIYVPSSYYLLSLIGQWPSFIILMFIYYPSISLLTPNPRTNGFVGLIAMEILEHLVLPTIMLITLFINPLMFYPIFSITILAVYGLILGETRTFKDLIKLGTLCFILSIGLWIPELLLYASHTYNFSFSLATLLLCAICSFSYLYLKKSGLHLQIKNQYGG